MTDLNVGSGVQTQALELEQQHFCSRDTSTVPYLLIFIMNFFLKPQYIWLKYYLYEMDFISHYVLFIRNLSYNILNNRPKFNQVLRI